MKKTLLVLIILLSACSNNSDKKIDEQTLEYENETQELINNVDYGYCDEFTCRLEYDGSTFQVVVEDFEQVYENAQMITLVVEDSKQASTVPAIGYFGESVDVGKDTSNPGVILQGELTNEIEPSTAILRFEYVLNGDKIVKYYVVVH